MKRIAVVSRMIVFFMTSVAVFARVCADTADSAPPARPRSIPFDPSGQRAFEAQQEAFRAYQQCVAEHRKEVGLVETMERISSLTTK